jgi:hypothetical protein
MLSHPGHAGRVLPPGRLLAPPACAGPSPPTRSSVSPPPRGRREVRVGRLACELPTRRHRPLARWRMADPAAETRREGLVAIIRDSPVWLWLHARRSAARAHGAGYSHGTRTSPPKLGVCSTSKRDGRRNAPPNRVRAVRSREIQHPSPGALPSHSPAVAGCSHVRRTRGNRGRAWPYLATWEAHRGKLIGICKPTNGNDPFYQLEAQVMARELTCSATRVF